MKYLIICLIALTPFAHAASSQCPQHYADGYRPDTQGTELCFDYYATLYRTESLTGAYSAEHLTAEQINKAEQLERHNPFHPDPSISNGPKPKDYHHTGFDRGHLAPSGDMPTGKSQWQSFDMVNMTPQTPHLNRGVWERVERGVRREAKLFGSIYVITGAIFTKDGQHLPAGEKVPAAVYKAVYIPSKKQCRVYMAADTDTPRLQIMSLSEFTKQYYLSPFKPGLCN